MGWVCTVPGWRFVQLALLELSLTCLQFCFTWFRCNYNYSNWPLWLICLSLCGATMVLWLLLGNRGGDTGCGVGWAGTEDPMSINNSPMVKEMQICRWTKMGLGLTKKIKKYLTYGKGSIYSNFRCNVELQSHEERQSWKNVLGNIKWPRWSLQWGRRNHLHEYYVPPSKGPRPPWHTITPHQHHHQRETANPGTQISRRKLSATAGKRLKY